MFEEMEKSGIKIMGTETLIEAPVYGDHRRLQQVLLNLLMNARDAMPDGGVIVLDLSLAQGTKQEAELKIIDEGSGLQGVGKEKLFEPFWTSKEKGSGLGLAMSRRIVEDMGGRLELHERKSSTGVVALIALPITTEHSAKER